VSERKCCGIPFPSAIYLDTTIPTNSCDAHSIIKEFLSLKNFAIVFRCLRSGIARPTAGAEEGYVA